MACSPESIAGCWYFWVGICIGLIFLAVIITLIGLRNRTEKKKREIARKRMYVATLSSVVATERYLEPRFVNETTNISSQHEQLQVQEQQQPHQQSSAEQQNQHPQGQQDQQHQLQQNVQHDGVVQQQQHQQQQQQLQDEVQQQIQQDHVKRLLLQHRAQQQQLQQQQIEQQQRLLNNQMLQLKQHLHRFNPNFDVNENELADIYAEPEPPSYEELQVSTSSFSFTA